MPRKTIIVLATAVAIAAVLSIAACNRGTAQGAPLKVGEKVITEDEFHKRLEQYMVQPQGAQGGSMPAGYVMMAELINESIILQRAEKEGVSPTDQEVDERVQENLAQNQQLKEALARASMTTDDYKRQVRRDLARFKLMTKNVSVTDQEVKDYFESNKERFRLPQQTRVLYLMTQDPEKMKVIDSELQGRFTFEALVPKYSQDPNSGVIAGENTISLEDPNANPEVKAALTGKKNGDRTGWVKISQQGQNSNWRFQVVDVRQARMQTFDEVKRQIRDTLLLQKGQLTNNELEVEIARDLLATKIEIKNDGWKKMWDERLKEVKRLVEAFDAQKAKEDKPGQ